MTIDDVDVVVVGSGGAGLMAACRAADLGLRVLVAEASDQLGGTTAWSGGQMWVPNSLPMRRAGYADDPAAARTYLDRVTIGRTPSEVIDAFIARAPMMVDYLESDLAIPVMVVERNDYHPDWVGAAFGRTLEPGPVETTALGSWAARTRTSPTRRPVTGPESRKSIDPALVTSRERRDVRTQGSGLVAGLVAAALRRQVVFRTTARLTSVRRADDTFHLSDATRGYEVRAQNLVLAAGGFAQSPSWRRQYLPLVDINPTGPMGNNGDGIKLGSSLGGRVGDMAEAWWTPSIATPDGVVPVRNVVRELAYPGSILVNTRGRRFVDEASSYNDLTKAMLAFDAAEHTFPNAAAWLVFDAHFRARRSVAGVAPANDTPSWMILADDIATLAMRTAVDPETLSHTVSAMNGYAMTGVDPDFGRGGNAHDRFNGDASHTPNPCLGPIRQGPFYAVPVTVGMNGTKGGLIVDGHSRVLDAEEEPIDGLFAVGESAAALMGPGYAGSGASLGPALTAGYAVADNLRKATP